MGNMVQWVGDRTEDLRFLRDFQGLLVLLVYKQYFDKSQFLSLTWQNSTTLMNNMQYVFLLLS